QTVDDQPGGQAEPQLAPLATAALDNPQRRGPSAQTGPVVSAPPGRPRAAAPARGGAGLAVWAAGVGGRGAPRPVHAAELLPERALLGDRGAIDALNEYVVLPLAAAGSALADTLDAYLDCGGAVETCARQLYVHPNTVRYRLKRIAEITGRDPMNPRDAYVLRIAATVGRLTRMRNESSPPAPEASQATIGSEGL
uniref:PucR family transcriptional regulator n=1 Tax=Nocardia farcinica TaxID=37329 RepID=UPI002457376A